MTIDDFKSYLACDCCQGNPIVIKYDKRFPVQPKKGNCRGCGASLPSGRTGWCCNKCYARFEPKMVNIAVKQRDKSICHGCGINIKADQIQWRTEVEELTYFQRRDHRKKPVEEYDHIIPYSEGGLTVLENMRTMCSVCHKKRTSEWRKSRAKAL